MRRPSILKALSEEVEIAGNIIAVSIHLINIEIIFPIAVFKNIHLVTLLPVSDWQPAAKSIILNSVRVNSNIKII